MLCTIEPFLGLRNAPAVRPCAAQSRRQRPALRHPRRASACTASTCQAGVKHGDPAEQELQGRTGCALQQRAPCTPRGAGWLLRRPWWRGWGPRLAQRGSLRHLCSKSAQYHSSRPTCVQQHLHGCKVPRPGCVVEWRVPTAACMPEQAHDTQSSLRHTPFWHLQEHSAHRWHHRCEHTPAAAPAAAPASVCCRSAPRRRRFLQTPPPPGFVMPAVLWCSRHSRPRTLPAWLFGVAWASHQLKHAPVCGPAARRKQR